MSPSIAQSSPRLIFWMILVWPSQLPDLKPRENLLWDLWKEVAAHKPKDIRELQAVAHHEYANISSEHCQKLASCITFATGNLSKRVLY